MQFSHKMRLYFFYTMVQKSQNNQIQIKGGGGPAMLNCNRYHCQVGPATTRAGGAFQYDAVDAIKAMSEKVSKENKTIKMDIWLSQ